MATLAPVYRATLNGAQMAADTLADLTAGVADAVTRALAEDPDSLADDAAAIHAAFRSGEVARTVAATGTWSLRSERLTLEVHRA